MTQTLEQLLQQLELGQYVAKFKEEDISSIQQAQSLSENDLKELGLTLGARKKLTQALHPAGSTAAPGVTASSSPSSAAAATTVTPGNSPSKFPRADPLKEVGNSKFSLEFRKGLRDTAPELEKWTERLRKLFGQNDWYFSIASYADIYNTIEQKSKDMHKETVLRQLAGILHSKENDHDTSVVGCAVRNLEKMVKEDAFNGQVFVEKTPAHCISIRVGQKGDVDLPHKFRDVLAYYGWVDGAFVVLMDIAAFPGNLDYVCAHYELVKAL